jgi:hypothetical protein
MDLVPSMGRAGYSLEAQDERSLTFVSRFRSGWVIFVAIFFFPIGLLALLAEKRTASLLVSMEGVPEGTQIIYAGEAFGGLRKQIEYLPEIYKSGGSRLLYFIGVAAAMVLALILLSLVWSPLVGIVLWGLLGFGIYKLIKRVRK